MIASPSAGGVSVNVAIVDHAVFNTHLLLAKVVGHYHHLGCEEHVWIARRSIVAILPQPVKLHLAPAKFTLVLVPLNRCNSFIEWYRVCEGENCNVVAGPGSLVVVLGVDDYLVRCSSGCAVLK